MRAREVPIAWRPELPVFASERFLAAVGDRYGWIGGIDEGGAVRCILPYTILSRPMLRIARFRVETIALGDPPAEPDERSFLAQAVELLGSIGADLIVPAPTNAVFRTCPPGAAFAPYGTWEIDLRQEEDALIASFSAGHRRLMRKAEKAGIRIREAPDLAPVVHRIVRDTFARSSMRFMSWPSFERYLAGLSANVRILVAERRNVVQACMVAPFSRCRAYYVYGGSVAHASDGAMHLLHREAMRLFRSLGVAMYDFVGARIDPPIGSKQHGLSTFKQRFGGRLRRGYVWKIGMRPGKYALYNLYSRYLRGGDVVDQEARRPQVAADGHNAGLREAR